MGRETVKAWRESGAHLPKFMRDFHAQKDLFKTIDEFHSDSRQTISWRDAHIYTIDFFLWFMARHGYTLQKTRTRLPFDDVEKTVSDAWKARQQAHAEVLNEFFASRNPTPHSGEE
jgi:hypothetical protein